MRGLACQRPNTVVYVAGAPTHGQRERDDDPWAKMDAAFSERHLIAPLRAIVTQCKAPAHNMVCTQSIGFGTGQLEAPTGTVSAGSVELRLDSRAC